MPATGYPGHDFWLLSLSESYHFTLTKKAAIFMQNFFDSIFQYDLNPNNTFALTKAV